MIVKTMKYVAVSLLALGLAASVYAMAPGAYMGIEAGKTFTNNKPADLQVGVPTAGQLANSKAFCTSGQFCPGSETIHPANTGLGGRIFLGYNVTEYWGFEGGFAHYALTTYNVPDSPALTIGNPTGKPAISTNGFDFDGKVMLPIGSFGLFARAGFAIIKVGEAGTLITTYDTTLRGNVVGSRATTYLRPVAGLGGTYDFNQNWQLQLSASRVFGGGGMQPADLVALGFVYHFVDKYCGQFLC